VEELTSRLARELTERGCRVAVATNRWPDELPRREVIHGIPVHRYRFVAPARGVGAIARFLVGFPFVTIGVIRSVRKLQPTVVHVQCISVNAFYAWIAARALRVPLVVTLQGELTMDTDQVYQRSSMLRRLLRHLLRTADAVTACSRQTLDEAEAAMGVRTGERGSVVFNGVDLEELDVRTHGSVSDRYILAIGRHVPEKGFDVLIRAFALLDRDDVRLVIAGDGPERERLEKLAADVGLAGRVELPGRACRPRTVELFQGCELFVLPSRHEPFGIVNVEAMASAKAVIATSVGGVPEIVHNGENGLLVPPDDLAALAEAITMLLDDDTLRHRLGETGREAARSFSWSTITGQYLGVYESAAQRRTHRGWKQRTVS